MDKYRANDILNDMSDKEKDLLIAARDGFAYDEDDKAVAKLLAAGYLRVVNFEYVHARNSLRGVVTAPDGDKLLQELDNRPIVETREQNILSDGELFKATEVNVKDPNPAENVKREDLQPKAQPVRVQGEDTATNPGDVGTAIERDKDEDIQKADRKAAGVKTQK